MNNWEVVVHVAAGYHKKAFATFEETLDYVQWSRMLDPISITIHYNKYRNYYTFGE